MKLWLANTLNKLVFFPLANLGDWADHVGGDVYAWAQAMTPGSRPASGASRVPTREFVTDDNTPSQARVRALRDAAAAVAAWDQPQEGWPEENRCDRETVRRLARQLHAMADSAAKRSARPCWNCTKPLPEANDDFICAECSSEMRGMHHA